MSDWFRWSAFGAAEIVFVGCTTGNAATLLRFVVSKRRGSMIPFFGGIAGALGIVASPQTPLHGLWWLPLLVDPGSAFLVVTSLVSIARRRGKDPDQKG